MILTYYETYSLFETFLIYVLESLMEIFALSSFYFLPNIQHIYLRVFDVFQISDKMMFVILTTVVHCVLFFGCYGFYLACDRIEFLRRYKIQQDSKNAPSSELIKRTIVQSLIGQLIVQPITLYFIYDLAFYFGLRMREPFPSYFESFLLLFFQYHFLEVCFYFSHRLLHHPLLYKRFHKQHHEYKDPVSVSAEHSSTVEGVVSSQLPSVILLLFFSKHYTVFLLILVLRLLTAYEVHSGYSFPWSLGYRSEYHHFHHSVNVGNYSGAVFLDSLFGTNKAWMQHLAKRKKFETKSESGSEPQIMCSNLYPTTIIPKFGIVEQN